MGDGSWRQGLDPQGYRPHRLHALDRDWPETNCYIDVWIELLAALQLPVEPLLGFLVRADFEGDQWTFCKPPVRDLEWLYGIEIEELNLWRSLLEHAGEQLSRDRLPLVEVDAYYLPDTQGTDYRSGHTKTTVAMVSLDAERKTLRYFHNRALYALEGADFEGIFRLDRDAPSDYLPPFCEIVKLDRLQRLTDAELRERALELARYHLDRRPGDNPLRRYGEQLPRHVRWLLDGGLETYHAYTFSLVRQLGASAELLSDHARWLGDGAVASAAAHAFAGLSAGAKTLLLKLARIANTGRERDLSPGIVELGDAWEQAMDRLAEALRR